MNKRRLLKLADLLERDARRKRGIKFDLIVVGSAAHLNADGTFPVDCKTQACAMGLAALSGAFKRAGLSYEFRESEFGGYEIDTTMNGRKLDYDRAAMAIFGITHGQANYLFSPSDYPYVPREAKGERFVARRIRKFVATGEMG